MPPRLPISRRPLLAFLALVAAAPALLAQYTPAVSYNRAQITVHTSAAIDRVIGWEFQVHTSFQATAVGVFDTELYFAPQGGLARSKAVGIWNLSQTLLASAVVPAGQGGQLQQDGFRYVSIPPTTLHAGQAYVIGSFWQQDDGTDSFDDYPDVQNSHNPVWLDPRISFVQPRYKLSVPGLTFPDASLPGYKSFLGAVNFRIGSGAPDANPPADFTTTFASNNGFAGNMFDLRATHPQGLTVDAWQVNLGDIVPQSSAVEVSVYWREGSYTAAMGTSNGWHHLGTTAVLSWGTNQPTPVPIGGLALPYGHTIGVYVFVTGYTQHPPGPGVPVMNYTGIGPAAPSYTNGALLLSGGIGKGAPPFTGETFLQRMWNGGIRYSVGASSYNSYCSGDGSAAACPCGNAGASGAGCTNSTGGSAVLAAQGSASISAGGPTLTGTQLVPGRTAVFFQGDHGIAGGSGEPFGDGLRCAGGGLLRIEMRTADGAGAVATTVAIPAAGGVEPGQVKRYQIWYRDPTASPCGTGFNTSQGLSIAWTP